MSRRNISMQNRLIDDCLDLSQIGPGKRRRVLARERGNGSHAFAGSNGTNGIGGPSLRLAMARTVAEIHDGISVSWAQRNLCSPISHAAA